MSYYLIVCRSMTFAQHTAAALERAGIPVYMIRAPKNISGEGCSFGVRLSERNLSHALIVFTRVGLTPNRIYITSTEGGYREVDV
jgi:Protein of unknown function (DUF3343).